MPRYGEVLSHWHYMADDFSTSALDFYSSVERRLKDRCVPEMGTERNDWKEGGMLSANRQYLRLRRGRYVFDVCAAPHGNSFFFSWWLSAHVPAYVFAIACGLLFGTFLVFILSVWKLGFFAGFLLTGVLFALAALTAETQLKEQGLSLSDTLSVMPLFGTFYARYLRPVTYYSLDTATMFQESVRRAINEEIDALRTAQGLRALRPDEIKVGSQVGGLEALQRLISQSPLGQAGMENPA